MHSWAEWSGAEGMARTGNEPGSIAAGTNGIKREYCEQLCASNADNLRQSLKGTQATKAQVPLPPKANPDSPVSAK